MKKIAMLLVVALLVCMCASAEIYVAGSCAIELPEGFEAVSEQDMQGYREAAAQDVGAVYEGEALLAVRGEESISVVQEETDLADTFLAAEALIAEYGEYIDGFESVQPQTVSAGGHDFSMIQLSLDGETTSQYLLLEKGVLFMLTFIGVSEEDTLFVLESFATAAAQSDGSAAQADAPAQTDAAEQTAQPTPQPALELAPAPSAASTTAG